VLASPTQSRPADRLFDAALDGGAHATGRPVGALAQGSRADWLVLDDAHPGIGGHAPETWLSSAVFCEHGDTPIRDVFVSGRKVIDARRHAQEDEALARYRAALRGLLD
jgi:formimidoylglutamate deiminase